MMIGISRTARETMLALAAADPRHEVCGLLFGQGDRIDLAVPAKNVAVDTGVNFEIDPVSLIAALRSERTGGPALLGYFHSHPNGLASPSATDIAMAASDNRVWIIIGSELTAWRATLSGFVELDVNEMLILP
jgi:proteasome lid subunit RPN8/RPN11